MKRNDEQTQERQRYSIVAVLVIITAPAVRAVGNRSYSRHGRASAAYR